MSRRDRSATRVIFRTDRKDGEVIAVLLDCEANPGRVVYYVHVGQHGEGDYWAIMGASRPATEAERAPLKRELEGIGYDLIERKRRSVQPQRARR